MTTPTRRTPGPLLALVLAALVAVAVGCASAPADDASRGPDDRGTTPAVPRALLFARCMRAHGVREFPDPDARGELTIDAIANGSSLDTSSALFTQALTACKDLEPPGFTGHERSADQQRAALSFARCIRDHGVPDFPDPLPDAPLVDTNRIPSSDSKGGMNTLNAAMKACQAVGADAMGDR